MQEDEKAIRDLVQQWASATARGDLAAIEELMTEDVVFLRSGHPPMVGKAAFIEAFRKMPPLSGNPPRPEILEIIADGNIAWMRSHLEIKTPAFHIAGDILTVLRKQNGRWMIARDANLLGPA